MSPIKIHIPCITQYFEYDCGATAYESICKYNLVGPNSHEEFIKLLKTNIKGTKVSNIKNLSKILNLNFLDFHNMSIAHLEWFINLGKPVLCPIRAWSAGHYVVAIGFDDNKIYFEDPFLNGFRGHIENQIFKKMV